MDWWKEKTDFWHNKTHDNGIYTLQKKELAGILLDVVNQVKASSLVDVCGYNGVMREYLPSSLSYKNYDIAHGMDVTKLWDKQVPKETFDISFTSLGLICFDQEKMEFVFDQMLSHTRKAIVIYEEYDPSQREFCKNVNGDYGGKWRYNWQAFIRDLKNADAIREYSYFLSRVNPTWSAFVMYL